VVAHQVPTESVLVRVSASGATTSCALATVCGSRQSYDSRGAPIRETAPSDDVVSDAEPDTGGKAAGGGDGTDGPHDATRGRGRRRRTREG
jgi:hypothetical protein